MLLLIWNCACENAKDDKIHERAIRIVYKDVNYEALSLVSIQLSSTGNPPVTLNYLMETLHFNCRRPTGYPPQTSKKSWTLFNFSSIAVPATTRNLYGNMIAIGRRWVVGSFRSLIGFNATKNEFHFLFISKLSTEESYSPVGSRWVKTIWTHALVAMSPVRRQHKKVIWKPGFINTR